jgi:hypothetical protein
MRIRIEIHGTVQHVSAADDGREELTYEVIDFDVDGVDRQWIRKTADAAGDIYNCLVSEGSVKIVDQHPAITRS